MLVRTADPHTIDAFATLPGPPLHCFVAEEAGEVVARVAVTPMPELFATQPDELMLSGLWWPSDHRGAGEAVFRAALELVPPGRGVSVRTVAEVHEDIPGRLALLEAAGFAPYQEKQGYWWEYTGQPLPPPRQTTTRPLAAVGREAFAGIVAEVHTGSLDRHDRHRAAMVGAEHEAGLMLEYYHEPADRDSWLVAEVAGEPVGFVAVSGLDRDDDAVGTIVYIGVRPRHRGHGYVDDLLRAANIAARRRGMHGMLSEVDVVNAPMDAAMRRNGHRPAVRPWHVWHHRRTAALVASE